MQSLMSTWLRTKSRDGGPPSALHVGGHKRKAEQMTTTTRAATTTAVRDPIPALESAFGNAQTEAPMLPPPSTRIVAPLDTDPIAPIVDAVGQWQQVKREQVEEEEQQEQQQQQFYTHAVAIKREEATSGGDENAMLDDGPFSPLKPQADVVKPRTALADLTNKLVVAPAPCKPSPAPVNPDDSDGDLASVTSADDDGYSQSVHQDPARTSADAIAATLDRSKRTRLTAHYTKLRWSRFDAARSVRLHSYDGTIRIVSTLSQPDYAACQSEEGEIRWIVRYEETKVMLFPLLFKMVISRDRFESKRDSMRLDEWDRAPRVRDQHPQLDCKSKQQMEQWMAQASVAPLYPSGPTHAAFAFASAAAPLLWTHGVEDCVAMVGLGGPPERAAVLAHLPALISLEELEAYWADKKLGVYSHWSLLTNQVSLFALRILRLVQRMSLADPVARASVSVDAPAHIVAQHGWVRRGHSQMRYLRQYFNPAGVDFERLQPAARTVVVDALQARIWAT